MLIGKDYSHDDYMFDTFLALICDNFLLYYILNEVIRISSCIP